MFMLPLALRTTPWYSGSHSHTTNVLGYIIAAPNQYRAYCARSMGVIFTVTFKRSGEPEDDLIPSERVRERDRDRDREGERDRDRE